MQKLSLVDFKDHFIREDGVIISSKGKERKAHAKNGNGHLIVCLSVGCVKRTVDVYKVLAKALFAEYDEDVHDVSFIDGNIHNLAFSNIKIISKIEGFRAGDRGLVKKVLKGVHIGWDTRAYIDGKIKYIGSSNDLERGKEICKEKFVNFMTAELIKGLFNEGKEDKIPKLFPK